MLHKAFKAKRIKQSGLVSMVCKFFDKKTAGSGVLKNENMPD